MDRTARSSAKKSGAIASSTGLDSSTGGPGLLRRVASAVARVMKGGRRKDVELPIETVPERESAKTAATPARSIKRETDIPLEQLEQQYTPNQTSVKAGFRASGDDHQRDQQFATGAGETDWNEEDLLTNRSGDPRIGTHGRTYEPGESRPKSNP